MHMLWGLHAPLRFVAAMAVDFSLGRVWAREVGTNACRGLRPACAGAACSADDVLRRPWHGSVRYTPTENTPLRRGADGPYAPMPVRPPVAYTYGAAETRAA